jgi:predicted MFS family arabinose efflux permease
VNSLWQMHAFWGVVVGMGTGGVAGVIGAAVASTWFESRRGLVTGILGGAMSAGQLVFLPVVRWLTDAYGWRTAIVFLAVLLGGVVWPLLVLLIRSRPADVGLTPYGAGSMGTAAMAQEQRSTPIAQAVRTGDFWLLAMSFGVCGFTTMGLIGTHFVPHAVEHGFTRAEATWILAILGAFNVVGTMASGWLCDRYSPRMLLASYYFFRALSLLALPLISGVDVLPLAFMSGFAVIFGLDYIATVPPTVLLVAERFGRRSMGTIYGWITFVHMAGGAAAAYFAGWVHDSAGEYTAAFYIAGVLGLLAAAMAFSVRTRREPVLATAAAAG